MMQYHSRQTSIAAAKSHSSRSAPALKRGTGLNSVMGFPEPVTPTYTGMTVLKARMANDIHVSIARHMHDKLLQSFANLTLASGLSGTLNMLPFCLPVKKPACTGSISSGAQPLLVGSLSQM